MKHFLIAFALLAACASSGTDQPKFGIDVAQVAEGSSAFYFAGPVNVQFQITITNPTDEPATLRHVRLGTSGAGAYVIQPHDTPTNLAIPPKSSATVTVPAWGTALGGPLYSHAPVTLRLTAYLDTPHGAILQPANTILPQE